MAWQRINERIAACRSKRTLDEVIDCLRRLFEETDDGMVAFALGEEMEKAGNIDAAETYYQEAEQRFPLPAFKKRATDALARLSAKAVNPPIRIHRPVTSKYARPASPDHVSPLDHDLISTLFLVSCTKQKIWDMSSSAPEYVPARDAYVGDEFLKFMKWAGENELERRGFKWMILSGKYGFIEPWHPIGYYDIQIDDEASFPVTIDYLKNQVRQLRWGKDHDGRWSEYRLSQFSAIVCVNCGQAYLSRIQTCFPDRTIKVERT